jgi:NAD(P)H-dependent flavin oxidoreductase YrpB (nitropropane dioxygenase family)
MLKGFSMAGLTPPRDVQIFTMMATFSHVWRTKLAVPDRPVGINFLRKIERVLLYGLYGAMLAGVDWVVMGAGDPGDIPAILDDLARHHAAELAVQVATVPHGAHRIRFAPTDLVGLDLPPPARPAFLAIVSSHLQAEALAGNPVTRPEGFVVEGPAAGGHNAPPRNRTKDERGNYVYGPEDEADLDAVAAVGLPFWVAGGRGGPPPAEGAPGNGMRRQVGTLFALSNESGMDPDLRRRVLGLVWHRELEVVASANASPSTFPFRVARVPGTVGDPVTYAARPRVCNLGYLRGWRPRDGRIVGLCPADDPARFRKLGGPAWRTEGSICLCNGLLATCRVGQPGEPPLVTLGDTTPVRDLQARLRRLEYSADEAAAYLVGDL